MAALSFPAPPPPPPVPAKLGFSEWLRTSPWWHKVLVLLPLLLVALGGLLGALVGLLMATANQSILRSRLGTTTKLLICLLIIGVGAGALLLIVAIVDSILGVGSRTVQG